jgi:tetratricopeptide (TPR) repeat protein
MVGQTLRLKNLEPGLYVACFSGTLDRQKCQSLDLNAPTPGKPHRFNVTLQPPQFSAQNRDTKTVTKNSLSVPRGAREQLVASEKAELNGQREAARMHLERALEIFPDFPEALNNLGTIYYRKGKFERAVELFGRAKDVDPDCYAAWINLAGGLTSLARFDEAMTAAETALELRPNAALANSHTGLLYFYRHDYVRAKSYFEKALSLDPVSSDSPQLFLAHIALSEQRLDDAEAYYRNYLEHHPHAPDAEETRHTLRLLETRRLVVSGNMASSN